MRHISRGTEFLLVIIACFWWAIGANVAALSAMVAGAPPPAMTVDDGRLFTIVIIEVIGLLVASLIGYARGWSLFTFGLRPTWRGTLLGVALAAAVLICVGGMGLLISRLWPGAVQFGRIPGTVGALAIVALALVNPLIEEAFEVGYVFYVLGPDRMWTAVILSAALRTFLHACQGVTALVIILPLGVAFALVYRRTHNLWPLIVAHALFDVAAFI
jgi:membrane protease YdiL (CAAX protease family)